MRPKLVLLVLVGCPISWKQENQDQACAVLRSGWFRDRDGDGHGGADPVEHPPASICVPVTDESGTVTDINLDWTDDGLSDVGDRAYDPEDGEVMWFTKKHDDCDDLDPDVYPGSPDFACDEVQPTGANGVDDDCNGVIDDPGVVLRCYQDSDGDEYTTSEVEESCLATAGSCPEGTLDAESHELDCDDSQSAINPGASETQCADDVDEDCADGVDCAVASTIDAPIALTSDLAVSVGTSISSVAMREVDLNQDGIGDLVFTDNSNVYVLPGERSFFDAASTPEPLKVSVRTTGAELAYGLAVSARGSRFLVGDADQSMVGEVTLATDSSATWATYVYDSSLLYLGAALSVGMETDEGLVWVVAYAQCSNRTGDSHSMAKGYDFYWNAWAREEETSDFTVTGISHTVSETHRCSAVTPGVLTPPSVLMFGVAPGGTTSDLAILDNSSTLYAGALSLGSGEMESIDDLPCQMSDVQSATVVQCPTAPLGTTDDCLAISDTSGSLAIHEFSDSGSGADCFTPFDGTSLTDPDPDDHADFGASISGAGDVDGDGYEDLLVGADGAAWLYLSEVDTHGTVTYSATPYAVFSDASETGPYQVAGGADLDGDGFDDIAILAGGTVYLFPGGPPKKDD